MRYKKISASWNHNLDLEPISNPDDLSFVSCPARPGQPGLLRPSCVTLSRCVMITRDAVDTLQMFVKTFHLDACAGTAQDGAAFRSLMYLQEH